MPLLPAGWRLATVSYGGSVALQRWLLVALVDAAALAAAGGGRGGAAALLLPALAALSCAAVAVAAPFFTASIAYSTCSRWPSGGKVVSERSYDILGGQGRMRKDLEKT